MSDENINPQDSAPKTNLLFNRISEVLKTKKIALIVIIILILIGIPLSLLTFSKKPKQPSSPTPTPSASLSPTITGEVPSSPTPTKFQLPPEGSYVPDQLIVKYKSGQSPEEIQDEDKKRTLESFLMANGMLSQERLHETNDPVLKTFFILKLKKGVDLQELILLLKEREEVESVELNYVPELF